MVQPGGNRRIPARPEVRHKRPKDDPAAQGAVIKPFYVADAFLWHATMDTGNPEQDRTDLHGIQLICYFHVPRGRTGFIKQIRVAPFMPEQFDIRYVGINRDLGPEPDAPTESIRLRPDGKD